MRAESLGIPSVLENAWGLGCMRLGVLPGLKAPRDDVTRWWNRADIRAKRTEASGTELMLSRS